MTSTPAEPVAYKRFTLIDINRVHVGVYAASPSEHVIISVDQDGQETIKRNQTATTRENLPLISELGARLLPIWLDRESRRAQQNALQSYADIQGHGRADYARLIESTPEERRSLAQNLAVVLGALRNFDEGRALNPDFKHVWEDRLEVLSSLLPSGSGIDNGVEIDRDASTADKLVLNVPYHAMDGNGFYTGWINYQVKAVPDFQTGLDVKVYRNGRLAGSNDPHADYLGDLFADCLREQCLMPDCLPAPAQEEGPTP